MSSFPENATKPFTEPVIIIRDKECSNAEAYPKKGKANIDLQRSLSPLNLPLDKKNQCLF